MAQEPFFETIRHLLLVEDSPMIAMDMEATLFDIGIARVSLAPSCREALVQLDAWPIDVALLDLFLGEETCLPVAEELVRRRIPFALCTGYGDATHLLGRLPPVPLLHKPHNRDQLVAILRQLRG